jgi:hypothetical protein
MNTQKQNSGRGNSGAPRQDEPQQSGDNRRAGDQDGNRADGASKSTGPNSPEVESDAPEEPEHLRPGDEDSDSGVD